MSLAFLGVIDRMDIENQDAKKCDPDFLKCG
jgi:hypothetical protein